MKNALVLVDDDRFDSLRKGLAYKKPAYGLMPYVVLLKKNVCIVFSHWRGLGSVANY